MRITSSMVTNTTLMHINRNMRNLDEVIRQLETTKRVSVPSDCPITAARALKFRTATAENEQFQRNVNNGTAWMNVTESAFTNINQELLRNVRELLVQGANDTLNLDNKKSIVSQIRSLFDEIGNQVNQRFAGRYLFSGLRTDEPPVFTQDNNRTFVLTQHFSLNDIARTSSFQRLPVDGLVQPVVHNINVLKLAYQGLDTQAFPAAADLTTATIPNPSGISIPGFQVVKISHQNANAYLPPAGGVPPTIHFIPETGELVMHSDVANDFPREGVSVTYQRTGFRQGEINPAVYFTARELDILPGSNPANLVAGDFAPPAQPAAELVYQMTQYFSRAAGTPVGAPPTAFQFDLAFPPSFAVQGVPGVFTDPAVNFHPQLPPGATLVGNVVTIPANLFESANNISVTYNVINPVPLAPAAHIMADTRIQGVELVRAQTAAGLPIPLDLADRNTSFNMNDQGLHIEFSTAAMVQINSLSKDLLTDKMFADFRRLFEFTDAIAISERLALETFFAGPPQNLTGTDLFNAVEKQISDEQALARSALYDVFNNMLYFVDRHSDTAMREQTQLGARMTRLHLLQTRLEADAVSLENLTSQNEDTDMIAALVRRVSIEATFQASLHANSGIIQMTLAQFLR